MGRKRHGTHAETDPPETGGAPADPAAAVADAGQPGANGDGPAGAASDRVARLESELAEMKDRYLRALADTDNVRRRMQREIEDARRYGTEQLVSDLLPILDNFNRALEAARQAGSFEALMSGVQMIHRQLGDALERAGLQRIEAQGQPFDPNVHDAIMQVPAQDGQAPGQVVEELQPGYRLNDRVVRPTLVKVTTG